MSVFQSLASAFLRAGPLPLNSFSRQRCQGPGSCSSGEPFRKFHGESIERRLPVVNRHRPLLGNVAHGQVDHLVDRLIRGKDAVIARHLAQRHVHGLNGIGRVDHLANVC